MMKTHRVKGEGQQAQLSFKLYHCINFNAVLKIYHNITQKLGVIEGLHLLHWKFH